MKKNQTNNKAKKNQSSYQNHRKAWAYFEKHGYPNHKGLVLHHKDVNLITQDPVRYHQWRIKDLKVMTVAEHRSLHMSLQMQGKKNSKRHNKNISKGRQEHTTQGKIVRISNTLEFDNLAKAAEYLGCSRQLLSQVLRKNRTNRKAKGYTIELVDKQESNSNEKKSNKRNRD